MRVWFKLPFAVISVCAVSLAMSTTAAVAGGGAVLIVNCGQSIQAAIDAANPGDTVAVRPCVYSENLTITKDWITLRTTNGAGTVVLRPAKTPTPSVCIRDVKHVPGICVVGQINSNGTPGTPVTGTRIDGFVVEHFTDFGISLFNAATSTVTNSESRMNASYGISGFVLSGVRYANNVSHDNGEPGFYVGDSPHANAVVVGNRSFRNGVGGAEGFGFLFRDSSFGMVRDNSASDNCVGYVFVDSPAPGPLTDWSAVNNLALHNNGACPGVSHGPPPTSGIGFVLFGAQRTSLIENISQGNVPSGPSIGSGGILVLSSKPIGGSDTNNDLVARNIATGNQPFDIAWDKSGTGNKFPGNVCNTSSPGWICD
jgi:Right handed beta helix region